MSERGRVFLIFAVIAAAAGAGGYYFFKVYTPAQELAGAQAEVATWEEQYQAARECLLGKSPASSRTSEALAIREMSPDPWERRRCTPFVKKLNRGDGNNTGIKAIEDAWRELDAAAGKAAMAYARHVSESTTLAVDPLPQGLDELDAARTNLRKAAQLPITAHAGATLPAADVLPLADGDARLESLRIDAAPSAGGIVLFGKTATRIVQVTLTAGGAPRLDRVGPGSMRSVPDTSWGATATPDGVLAGAMDAEGAIAAPTVLPLAMPTIATVSGTLADGYLIFGNATDLVVARAKDGVVVPTTPEKITVAEAAVDVDGRAAVVWGTGEATKAQLLEAGHDHPILELPGGVAGICLTRDRVWLQAGGLGATAFGGGRPTQRARLSSGTLQGCTQSAALFRSTKQVTACSNECVEQVFPSGAPRSAAITQVDGKLVAIASHGGVLGVWRDGEPPVYYALPDHQTRPVLAHEWPAMALTDGKVIDVIARSPETFVIIRVPATQ